MKVSIVLPVFNGAETLKECLDAIAKIDYSNDDFELTIVNDGSRDNSHEIIKEFVENRRDNLNVKYINLEKNLGRIKARLEGVKASKYSNLLFIDHRGRVHRDIIQKIEEKSYQPIVGNPYQDKKESLIGNFFYVLRKIIYYPYWGEDFEDVYITEENFDQIAKGFCPFFCDKGLLLRHLPKERGRNISDDTLVFSNIVREKKILKTSDCKVRYSERDFGEGFISHLFNRGPKFVYFYFSKSLKYSVLIYFLAFSPVLFVLGFFLMSLIPVLLCFVIGISILALSITILKYSLGFRDLLSLIVCGPIVWFTFTMGILKGLLLKVLNRFGQ